MIARRFTAGPAVRHVESDGLRVILDLGRESYSVLDDAASLMWSVLVGERPGRDAFLAASNAFDIEEADWTAELEAFADRCLAAGLLAPEGVWPAPATAVPPPAPSPGYGPPLARALAHLLATRRALRRDGFRLAYQAYGRVPVEAPGRPLPALLRAFGVAENLFISRRAPRDCLLRSLSLFRFLRAFGVPAEHVIGVRRFPFQAHAWVEHRGSPLLDTYAPGFTAIARIDSPGPAGA